MKPNIRQLKKWIAALDSGMYTQTVCALEDCNGYCCLGVACMVVIPTNKLKTTGTWMRLYGSLPIDQPNAPKWLIDLNDDFNIRTGKCITTLNDTEGFSFTEIATLLELVYIHKMLD